MKNNINHGSNSLQENLFQVEEKKFSYTEAIDTEKGEKVLIDGVDELVSENGEKMKIEGNGIHIYKHQGDCLIKKGHELYLTKNGKLQKMPLPESISYLGLNHEIFEKTGHVLGMIYPQKTEELPLSYQIYLDGKISQKFTPKELESLLLNTDNIRDFYVNGDIHIINKGQNVRGGKGQIQTFKFTEGSLKLESKIAKKYDDERILVTDNFDMVKYGTLQDITGNRIKISIDNRERENDLKKCNSYSDEVVVNGDNVLAHDHYTLLVNDKKIGEFEYLRDAHISKNGKIVVQDGSKIFVGDIHGVKEEKQIHSAIYSIDSFRISENGVVACIGANESRHKRFTVNLDGEDYELSDFTRDNDYTMEFLDNDVLQVKYRNHENKRVEKKIRLNPDALQIKEKMALQREESENQRQLLEILKKCGLKSPKDLEELYRGYKILEQENEQSRKNLKAKDERILRIELEKKSSDQTIVELKKEIQEDTVEIGTLKKLLKAIVDKSSKNIIGKNYSANISSEIFQNITTELEKK